MIRRLTCPICEKELPWEIAGESDLFPFCSLRCKQADLNRWFTGAYAIADPLTPEKLIELAPDEESPE
jgi:endogenous inhibitor of DNA gyrase (YacG/DUF329 family)